MALDAYSPCPGGTGKKIKFCCSDLMGELQKIDRMLEGEQYLACLNHVESLLKKTPDRACLLATRSLLLRATNQLEAAEQAGSEFLQKHPQNPIALADAAALAALRGDGGGGMKLLLQALAATGDNMEIRVYVAMGEIAEALATEGNVLAALPLLIVQIQMDPEDPRPKELLAELQLSPSVPVLMKDQRRPPEAPADAPWKAKYDEIIRGADRLQWASAVERLADLIREVGDQPTPWRALAMVRGWIADEDGCIEALRKFVSLDVPLDDAVEAEALALMLSDDPLGDQMDVLDVTFGIQDIEQLQTAFALSGQMLSLPVDPASFVEDDSPPPRAIYHILDKALPQSAADASLDSLPRQLCLVLLYGRQTDREARLELKALRADDLDAARRILSDAAGPHLGDLVERREVGRISRSEDLISFRVRPPDDADMKQWERWTSEHREHALLHVWPQLPLGYFDGKTPEEAARLDEYRVQARAAVMLLESWFESRPHDLNFDFGRLRERLGLPRPEPIDAERVDIDKSPVIRWSRLMVEKLSDEKLSQLFRIASSYNAVPVVKHLGQAIIVRPGLEGKEERLRAYTILARIYGSSDQTLEYIERGRKEAEAAGLSSAPWDIQELSVRFGRFESEQVSRLLQHIESQHGREPGVREALMRFLMQIGAIRPDGTPAVQPRPQAGPEPRGGMPVEPATAEPGKIWTPESQRPAGEKRIWMPGMD